MKIDKSWLTDSLSASLVVVSFAIPEPYAHWSLLAGLFALSGAITNQIAIHMLFEKVPFLYGSGVIQLQFEAFKTSIKHLMMNQFFTKEQLDAFFEKEKKTLDLAPVIADMDFSPAFDALTKTVMESSFGGMLGMFGGERALEGLRAPFSEKLKDAIIEISESDVFQQKIAQSIQNSSLSDDMLITIEQMIDARLNELTPQMVKEIVQNFIKDHLGWLVVWGGFFGAVIGLLSTLVL
ncbi:MULTISPECIES: hypothetical protein [unclassified Sulfurospirillum]|uniref:hypothetical protein n=1 Tax=unclassified Sulfurospirillum TaxID=2618290 RepID=UPI0005011953|nr:MULTISPECIES: hypothetical protein [unclassified Sulfurospirillum]KFL35232.1 hypothetical protein JU57_00350 [Sulfurospirillum sp. SCADC]